MRRERSDPITTICTRYKKQAGEKLLAFQIQQSIICLIPLTMQTKSPKCLRRCERQIRDVQRSLKKRERQEIQGPASLGTEIRRPSGQEIQGVSE